MEQAQSSLASLRMLRAGEFRLLGVITGGHFIIHWFQQLFPVVLPSIKAGLGLNDIQVGALTSARQLVNGSMDLPAGLLADSVVRYRALLLASAIISMGTAYLLMGSGTGFVSALLGAGLVGLGTALWHPAAAASLSNQFPNRRATALSVHGMGATISDTLTPLGAGLLLLSFSWTSVLSLQILPALGFGVLLWIGLAGLFSIRESGGTASAADFREIAALVRNPAFVGVTVAAAFMSMGRVIVLTFLPIYIQEHLKYSPFGLGFYIALLHAMGTVSQPILGFLSDRFGRKAVLFPSFLTLGALFALLAVANPGLQLGVVISAIGLFFYTLMNITFAAVMDVAAAKIQASSYGLSSLMVQVAVFPIPILAGYLVQNYGIQYAFLLASGFLFMGGLLVLPLNLYRGSKR
ncbi:MAG: MFS transporter [Deltaproteobacteria bacterium]|nr:MFS transporter [Deltaproteobacteria bacterium]